jgi:serine/threonine-protein kinase
MEFLERLPAGSFDERWLVRDAGELRVAWAPGDDDRERIAAFERDSVAWLDFTHPRVSRLHSSMWIGERLVFVVEDDRGPSLGDAAEVLAGAPVDRERWAVAQVVALAGALAAMASRCPGFVYRLLPDHRVFVDPAGHARVRAPVALTKHDPRRQTRAGGLWGASWFTPETCTGKPITPATEVFLLASQLSYALTGRKPFAHENPVLTVMAIEHEPHDPIRTYAPGLDSAIARAFAKEQRKRYPDPAAFAAALVACIPDASDYDAVISDRIAAAWATVPPPWGDAYPSQPCRMQWHELAPVGIDSIRQCTKCEQPVVCLRDAVVPLVYTRCYAD